MSVGALRLLAVVLAMAVVGCAEADCQQGRPSMQVSLALSPGVAADGIAALRVEFTAGSLARTEDLETGPLQSSGRTTFIVYVGTAGVGGFTARVAARALGAAGEIIAWGEGTFAASGDACNAFTVLLSAGAGDGGLPDAAPVDAGADAGPGCSAATCLGCCLPSGVCAPGAADGVCGAGGVPCRDCTASGSVCQANACVGVTYAWKTGAWSACAAACGGGTQTRSVWCERSDGVQVGDALCLDPRPATSQSCNPQPCCATATLEAATKCNGTARVQWPSWGSNTGSASDRTSCAAQCTSWAPANGFGQWCCHFYEDAAAGTLWVCRVYDAYSTSAAVGTYAGLGQCQTP